MILGHRIALDPNNAQATYLARAAGTARFAYNWALAEWKHQYEAHKADQTQPKPSQMALRRQLNAVKREQFPWMLDVTKCAPQLAIIQLGEAFKRFFSGQNRYPTPRKKGVDDRFSVSNDQFSVDGSRIRISNLGWMRMREPLRFKGNQFEDHGREFHGFSLWRGRLWPSSQDGGETGLSEAGTRQQARCIALVSYAAVCIGSGERL
ncbi:RNA-guided endonuclease InsQ/TnpB family protein [Paraburkholderia sp. BR10954]|uniref:RNA-guided endonuclease InsQ/TnpB family protein n=1 Tax=Paraburkholderia sp. BR10954 TaxID=3236995 RepID=UPI0034D2EFE6